MREKIYILILLCFFSRNERLFAQQRNPLPKGQTSVKPSKGNIPANVNPKKDIYARAFSRNGKVYLRWVPGNVNLFREGVKKGYRIERIPLEDFMEGKDSATYSRSVWLTNNSVLPVSTGDSIWDKSIFKNKNAAFLKSIIYDWDKLFKATETDLKNKQQMYFGMAMKACDYDFTMAQLAGLTFIDSVSNGAFVYRVSLAGKPGVQKILPGTVAASTIENTPVETINDLKAKFKNKCVELSFEAEKYKSLFGGFNLEKSEDGINFHLVNQTPLTLVKGPLEKNKSKIHFIDSLRQNGITYYYRVKGISYFGFTGPESNCVKGAGKNSLGGIPVLDSTSSEKGNRVTVYFHYSVGIDSKEIKNTIIYKSDRDLGPYTNCNCPFSEDNGLAFHDLNPQESNYYRIALSLGDEDTLWSVPVFVSVPDVFPPAKPSELKGFIDSVGNVVLNWKINKESDLMGYRIFRANAKNDEFVEVSNKILSQNKYTEKIGLKNLTEEIFYKITAVDKNYNNSPYSEIVKIKKPDLIPPVATTLKNYAVSDSSITLTLIKSTSKDFVRVDIYRIAKATRERIAVGSIDAKDTLTVFVDKNIYPDNYFQYELITVDDDGNKSFYKTGDIYYRPMYAKINAALKAESDRVSRKIILNWNLNRNDVYSIQIYRAVKGKNFVLIETLINNPQLFEDKDLKVNNVYVYKIRAMLQSGRQTTFSNETETEY